MPPATGTALLILVAFVLPGFATVLIKERSHEAWREVNQLERVLQTGYYSVWNYLLLALFALAVGINSDDIETVYRHHLDNPAELIWRAALAILLPSFVVANASRVWEGSRLRTSIYERLGVNARHRIPTAWDAYFAKRSRAMVLATLKDSRVVGGYYGRNSFAAYSKDGRDLYLEQRWTLSDENWFQGPALESLGVWLPTEEVVSLELYAVNDDHDEDPTIGPQDLATTRDAEEGRTPASGRTSASA
jgi:hypothetical protein